MCDGKDTGEQSLILTSIYGWLHGFCNNSLGVTRKTRPECFLSIRGNYCTESGSTQPRAQTQMPTRIQMMLNGLHPYFNSCDKRSKKLFFHQSGQSHVVNKRQNEAAQFSLLIRFVEK